MPIRFRTSELALCLAGDVLDTSETTQMEVDDLPLVSYVRRPGLAAVEKSAATQARYTDSMVFSDQLADCCSRLSCSVWCLLLRPGRGFWICLTPDRW